MRKGQFEKGNKLGCLAKGVKKKFNYKQEVFFQQELVSQLIGSFKSGMSYVYYHINKRTKEIFYIGKGKNNRAWEYRETVRNPKWWEYVKENDYEVRIVCSMLSDNEVVEIERVLIKLNEPCCNEMHLVY